MLSPRLAAIVDALPLHPSLRVGVLGGRHPSGTERALRCIASVTTPAARLFIDGGHPLREVPIPRS